MKSARLSAALAESPYRDELVERELDLAYLAAIIDGEGSILWDARMRMIRVQVINTSVALMRWIGGRYLGSWSESGRRGRPLHHKACYRWSLSGNRAADLIERCIPYLVIKDERAEEVLGLWYASGPRRTVYREVE